MQNLWYLDENNTVFVKAQVLYERRTILHNTNICDFTNVPGYIINSFFGQLTKEKIQIISAFSNLNRIS